MIFLTGVPGFLGTRLLRALGDECPNAPIRLLVQPKYEEKAHRALNRLDLGERAELLPGDITAPDLGLGDRYDAVANQVTVACHLAAVYDLSIPRDVGWRVNVDGTRHVLDFLAQCPHLQRAGYVSTAYVSGRRTGTIDEDELVHDAGFKNFYEETKYHAEVLAQDRLDDLPLRIFRPAIVVGDSQTGETDKFDGPYFILRALQRLPRYTLMTRIGSGQETVNLVPVDYVVSAMTHLLLADAPGASVFHLTDPVPLSTQAILDLFADLLDMHVAHVPVPTGLARALMKTGAGRALGISPELIDYFDHPSRYDASNTRAALNDTEITCPRLPEYAPTMIEYMKTHADTRSSAMY
ncbi:MAG: SDR family oxidoreductase [Salinibacter sp.]